MLCDLLKFILRFQMCLKISYATFFCIMYVFCFVLKCHSLCAPADTGACEDLKPHPFEFEEPFWFKPEARLLEIELAQSSFSPLTFFCSLGLLVYPSECQYRMEIGPVGFHTCNMMFRSHNSGGPEFHPVFTPAAFTILAGPNSIRFSCPFLLAGPNSIRFSRPPLSQFCGPEFHPFFMPINRQN